jgi:hypothetical protein
LSVGLGDGALGGERGRTWWAKNFAAAILPV